MPKNINKTKKRDKFWSDDRFLNSKILNHFNKVHISQFIVKMLLKQRSLSQPRHCLTGHNQI